MARTRNIKPGFFRNEDLAELGAYAMLLYAGLWTIADREGRLEDRPKRIKVDVLPYFDQPVDELLDSLAKAGFIIRYDGFIAIPTWAKHQNPHVKETPSIIPAPDENRTSTVQEPDKNSSSRALTLNPSSLTLNPSSLPAAVAAECVPSKIVFSPDTENTSVLVTRSKARWEVDDQYAAFVSTWREAQPNCLPSEFEDAYRPFLALAFEQRVSAVRGITQRLRTGYWKSGGPVEWRMCGKPVKYLQGEWKRVIPDVVQIPRKLSKTETLMSEMFEEAEEEDRRRAQANRSTGN